MSYQTPNPTMKELMEQLNVIKHSLKVMDDNNQSAFKAISKVLNISVDDSKDPSFVAPPNSTIPQVYTLSEEERTLVEGVIQLQEEKNINTDFLKRILSYETLNMSQHKAVVQLKEDWEEAVFFVTNEEDQQRKVEEVLNKIKQRIYANKYTVPETKTPKIPASNKLTESEIESLRYIQTQREKSYDNGELGNIKNVDDYLSFCSNMIKFNELGKLTEGQYRVAVKTAKEALQNA